jgi:dimethylamine/trimethylamine dehydrogenase
VVVGLRRPVDALCHALAERPDDLSAAGIRTVDRIGDALAAGAVAHAVHSGHRYAQELDTAPAALPYRVDKPFVSAMDPVPGYAAPAE